MSRRSCKPSTPRPSADAGFTLLEMMVALALLAGMLALVPGTLRLAARAWHAQQGIDRSASVATARATMTQRLAQAMALPSGGDAADGAIAFAGEPQSVRFIAPAPQAAAGSGLLGYTLHLRSGAGGRRHLAIDTAPYAALSHSASSVALATTRHVILDDVDTLTLRYFGVAASGDAPPIWHARWSERARLPDLIEVSFDIADVRGRRRERVVVETRIGTAR